jgi:hypothetical protein
MKKFLRRRPSASMVVAMTALVVASSGTAIAAGLVSGNKLIKKGSLSGDRLVKHSVTGTQINLSKLGTVPSATTAKTATTAEMAKTATTAETATTATTAGTATNATTAGSATTAATAANALDLGGQPASSYLLSSAVQTTGVKVLTAGQSNVTLMQSGALTLAATCAVSSGVTTATLTITSTVANWLAGGGTPVVESAAGSETADELSDTTSPGSYEQQVDRIQDVAPSGASLVGLVLVTVNWPAAGDCMVNGYAVT